MAAIIDRLIVLHIRPYRDSSLIIESFSQNHGRIPLLAKGARAQNRRSERAALQMSAMLEANLSGRSEMRTLYQFDVVRPPGSFVGEEFAMASYISELVLRVTQSWDAMPEVFDAIAEAFQNLNHSNRKALSLRRLEWCLLQSLGTAIDFECEYNGAPIAADVEYELRVEEGFVALENLKHQNGSSFAGRDIIKIAKGDWESPSILSALKVINQTLLAPYLGSAPLRSRELWRQWRRRH